MQVQVYELAFEHCPKSYVFRGNKEITPKQVAEMLGLTAVAAQRPQGGAQPVVAKNRYVSPLLESPASVSDDL